MTSMADKLRADVAELPDDLRIALEPHAERLALLIEKAQMELTPSEYRDFVFAGLEIFTEERT